MVKTVDLLELKQLTDYMRRRIGFGHSLILRLNPELGLLVVTALTNFLKENGESVSEDQPSPSLKAGDQRFYAVLAQMAHLHQKKAQDYGKDEDPLANLRASTAFGIPAWVGAAIRAKDKIGRIEAMAKKGKLANESVEDSFIDLACYAILGLILYREKTEESKKEDKSDDVDHHNT